jgi:hypothetical protein
LWLDAERMSMGYACPVCEAPQADGEHLANHLAFSALLGHDDHGDWLDDNAPDWGEDDPDELAERVTPLAESVEYPAVFDDTTGERPDVDLADGDLEGGHDHVHSHAHGTSGPQQAPGPGQLDAEAREILDEARRLTEGAEDDRDDGDDGE